MSDQKNVNSVQDSLLLYIEKNIKTFPTNTELSIAIIQNKVPKYLGITKTSSSFDISNNSKKQFEIGSISKVFTSQILANLIENYHLNPDDNIKTVLNIENKKLETISFKQLANHTSGLPRLPSNIFLTTKDPNNPYANYHPENLNEYLEKELLLTSTPGSQYGYSNLGAGLLGYLLELKTNSTYEELIQKYILNVNGMESTTSEFEIEKLDLVPGKNVDGDTTSNWIFGVLVGAGGIISNIEDMSKFAISHMNDQNPVTTLMQQPTFVISDKLKIGLGWHIDVSENRNWIWHNGGTGGYSSCMVVDPVADNGIIILSNLSSFHPDRQLLDQLCFELMNDFH